jgi:cob(I)alamin adenosyltransferase
MQVNAQWKKDTVVVKKDTTVTMTCTLDEMRAFLYTIDQNIDSKKLSKDLVEFVQKRVQIVADKPKETPTKPKN